MKILVVAGIDPFASSNNRLHYFLRALSTEHEVLVVHVRDVWKRAQVGQSTFTDETSSNLKNVRARPFHSTAHSGFYQELYAWTFPQRVLGTETITSFDRVYIYNALLSGLAFTRLAKRHHLRVIIDVADDLAAMVRNSPQLFAPLRWFGGRVAEIALRRQAELADTVVLSAAALTSCIPSTAKQKIVVLRNGVNVQHFSQVTQPDNLKIVLGYVGVLREWVDFEPVFQAMVNSENQDVLLKIIGAEGRLTAIQLRVQQLGLTDRVSFLGAIPYADVPKAMSDFTVGLIPFATNAITRGALPLKLFEYAAAKKIIISTSLPEVQTVAQDEIYYADTPEAYSRIFQLLRQPQTRTVPTYTFVANADWDTIAKKFLEYVQ